MDEQIKKVFDKWWKNYVGSMKGLEKKVPIDVRKAIVDAFEQGWAEGVASMLNKASAKLSKMGRVEIRGPAIVVANEMVSKDRIPFCTENIGNILKKRKEKK